MVGLTVGTDGGAGFDPGGKPFCGEGGKVVPGGEGGIWFCGRGVAMGGVTPGLPDEGGAWDTADRDNKEKTKIIPNLNLCFFITEIFLQL